MICRKAEQVVGAVAVSQAEWPGSGGNGSKHYHVEEVSPQASLDMWEERIMYGQFDPSSK